jgi:hypothetical protein
MLQRRPKPYVWCSGIAKILAGESRCLWQHWFRAHFKYEKLHRGFDAEKWNIDHAGLVELAAAQLRADGFTVSTEDDNWFRLEKDGIVLGAKPDLIALNGQRAIVIDCKIGSQQPWHAAQMLIYLAMFPCARRQWKDHAVEGLIWYTDDKVRVSPEDLDQGFRDRLRATIKVVGGGQPPERKPGPRECAFCDIRPDDCPDRVEEVEVASVSEHDLF